MSYSVLRKCNLLRYFDRNYGYHGKFFQGNERFTVSLDLHVIVFRSFLNHVTIVIFCQDASAPGGVSLRAEGRKRRVGSVTACVTRQEGVFH